MGLRLGIHIHVVLKNPGNLRRVEAGSNWNSLKRPIRDAMSGPNSNFAGSVDYME